MKTPDSLPELAACLSIEAIPAADMTHDFFMENYFNTRTPVVLKDACSNWEFMQKWTLDYLTTELGDYQCTVARDSRPAFSKETCSLKDYFQDYSHLSTITFEPFDPENKDLPRFLEDIPLPNPFFSKNDISAYFFFHANEKGGSLPHCHMDAFNLLQKGTKRWVMYDADPEIAPHGWEILKKCHEEYAKGTHSKDWFIDGPNQARREGVTIYDGVQEIGDIVFIPEHFSHAVLNLSETQGMVIIAERAGKAFNKEEGSGYSPNSVHADR